MLLITIMVIAISFDSLLYAYVSGKVNDLLVNTKDYHSISAVLNILAYRAVSSTINTLVQTTLVHLKWKGKRVTSWARTRAIELIVEKVSKIKMYGYNPIHKNMGKKSKEK